jgi:hypothetical protein
MASYNPKHLGNDEAPFVYRDSRLLIGYRTAQPPRIEAWLGYINEEEAARNHNTNNDPAATTIEATTTDRLRVYTSSDGSMDMYRGVMGVDEAHPAVLASHTAAEVASFLDFGKLARFKWVENIMDHVRKGRSKYCEREGGELKGFEWVDDEIVEQVVEVPKRDCGCDNYSPTPSADLHTDNGVCDREVPDGHDDEDPIHPKNEKPASSGSKSKDMTAAHQPTNITEDLCETIIAFLASLNLGHDAIKDEKKAEQKKVPTLTELTNTLACKANEQLFRWALCADSHGIDLNRHQKELSLGETVEDTIKSSRDVIADLARYCEVLRRDFLAQEVLMWKAEANMKPRYVLAAHRNTVAAYKKNEAAARDSVRGLEMCIERIEKRVTVGAASR